MTPVAQMLNVAAWRDGLGWAIEDRWALEAFRDTTGVDLVTAPLPIEHLVDEATGKRRQDLESFIDWFTEEIWGADMDPITKGGKQPGTPDGPAVYWSEGVLACGCGAVEAWSDSS